MKLTTMFSWPVQGKTDSNILKKVKYWVFCNAALTIGPLNVSVSCLKKLLPSVILICFKFFIIFSFFYIVKTSFQTS